MYRNYDKFCQEIILAGNGLIYNGLPLLNVIRASSFCQPPQKLKNAHCVYERINRVYWIYYGSIVPMIDCALAV
jgi:hypothetical protein